MTCLAAKCAPVCPCIATLTALMPLRYATILRNTAPSACSIFAANAAAMAAAPEGALEAIIRPVGLYKTKAKNLRAACARLVEVYGGEIPREMADLLSLAGVGRKVANLLRGDLYGLGGIVADTHCIRISNRLGLADTQNPHGVEKALDVLVPKEEQSDFCHRLVLFGREICSARKPLCGECPMAGFCSQRQGDR